MTIYSVYDRQFRYYGAILEGYNFKELFDRLKSTPSPEKGIIYSASVPELEECNEAVSIKQRGFGGIDIEIGYCNGTNSVLNCLEYHKSSEFNIPSDDIVLLLALRQDIKDGMLSTSHVKAFHVPAGTGVELYATTLHYAPCGFSEGQIFRMLCVLPKGTNECAPELSSVSMEDKMCFGRNKWLLAHPDSEEARNGAYSGLTGDNLIYPERGKRNDKR